MWASVGHVDVGQMDAWERGGGVAESGRTKGEGE